MKRRNEFLDHETDGSAAYLPGFSRPKAYGEANGTHRGRLLNTNDDSPPRRNRSRRSAAAAFRRYAEESNRFINDVADELGTDDTGMALRVTRAVLHAVRDRITPDDAVQFGQGLPMMLKGIYFDQYDISRTPVVIRSTRRFLEYIQDKNRFAAVSDFRYEDGVIRALQAVFTVLENHMSIGQVDHVLNLLPAEVCELINRAGAEAY
ncbi:MAG TPA: DUF2267 domain-containing protein [Bacteroidia bacterium]|nr:DUF2267 domain-containing protein [Bacteroidia bacterium]